ncbi:MAG TPA: hypothetical protein VFT99_16720, partial [Roseiflexaceae bacterium]|nr:hypothetical protein [Roseiflexaceae bacterium]
AWFNSRWLMMRAMTPSPPGALAAGPNLCVEDIGSVSTLTFKDPDENLLMVCQSNRASAQ